MNQTIDIIMNRFSCRAYTNEPVSNDALETIAKAAMAAPTAINRQAYRVVVIRDKSLIEKMDSQGMQILKAQEDQGTYERFMQRGGTLFYNAPVLIILPIKSGTQTDLGIVAQNIVLAATSLGLGSCHCGMARLLFENDNRVEYEKLFGFPDGYTFGLAVLIGHIAKDGVAHTPDMTKVSYIG